MENRSLPFAPVDFCRKPEPAPRSRVLSRYPYALAGREGRHGNRGRRAARGELRHRPAGNLAGPQLARGRELLPRVNLEPLV